MDDEVTPRDEQQDEPQAPRKGPSALRIVFGRSGSGRWSDSIVRALWIAAAVYVAVLAVGAAAANWTAFPGICASCHEIRPYVVSWRTSPHARTGCPDCHEPVRPWYRFPQTFAFRAQMAQRDIAGHQALAPSAPLKVSGAGKRPVPDENCLHCHDLSRQVTLPPGIVMDHAKHVKRNKSCISCHRTTAHPAPDAEQPMLLMAQCFTCHGRTPGSKAPGNCELCHPASFTMRPASHKPTRTWLSTHGRAAEQNRQPCAMCHETAFCTSCHGLQMPHPSDWVKGPNGHSDFAKTNSKVCVQCHGEGPTMCSMCHHKAYEPGPGPWASNHAPSAKRRGIALCLSCHDPLFCVKCHTSHRSRETTTP